MFTATKITRRDNFFVLTFGAKKLHNFTSNKKRLHNFTLTHCRFALCPGGLPTALESHLVYACELWVFAMCPALRGSTVSYAGVAHFPKHSLEYSLDFWSQSKKITRFYTPKKIACLGYVAHLPTWEPLLILYPALKRKGPPRRQGLCSQSAHL